MTIILGILAALIILGAWGTAELNYRATNRKSRFNEKKALQLQKKAQRQDSLIEHYKVQLAELQSAYDYTKATSNNLLRADAENKILRKDLTKHENLKEWLEKKVKSQEFTGNSLAKVILAHIENQFPSKISKEVEKLEETKQVFKRIKKTINE